jgi:hypothetical protein
VTKRRASPRRRAATLQVAQAAREIESVRKSLDALGRPAARLNANADDVQRSVAQLVLTLVEFIRRLLERQAIRRMEAGTLTEKEIEQIGTALMRLERTIRDMARRFGLKPEDLNLDLGVGRLM